MMKRDDLNRIKESVTKGEYYPTSANVRLTVDSHLEALDLIDVLREEIADLRPLVEKCENQEIELRYWSNR